MKITKAASDYLNHLKILGRSVHTIRCAKYDLDRLIKFLNTEHVHHIEELTAEVLTDYQQELCFCLTAKGRPLSVRTQAQRLGVIKGFTRYLKHQD